MEIRESNWEWPWPKREKQGVLQQTVLFVIIALNRLNRIVKLGLEENKELRKKRINKIDTV